MHLSSTPLLLNNPKYKSRRKMTFLTPSTILFILILVLLCVFVCCYLIFIFVCFERITDHWCPMRIEEGTPLKKMGGSPTDSKINIVNGLIYPVVPDKENLMVDDTKYQVF